MPLLASILVLATGPASLEQRSCRRRHRCPTAAPRLFFRAQATCIEGTRDRPPAPTFASNQLALPACGMRARHLNCHLPIPRRSKRDRASFFRHPYNTLVTPPPRPVGGHRVGAFTWSKPGTPPILFLLTNSELTVHVGNPAFGPCQQPRRAPGLALAGTLAVTRMDRARGPLNDGHGQFSRAERGKS